MSNLVCWDHGRIQYASAIDVGGLDVDDPRGDAVFAAIHQPIPVLRHRDVGAGGSTSRATEGDVLREFEAPLSSNEPRLVFIRGGKGTGKSHLVRWLKANIGTPASWHIVYIEKRNTSLRRVTDQILAGITGERAEELRRQLAQASADITTDEEAVSALIMRLHHLVKFDTEESIKGLAGLSAAELKDLRAKSDRLLGDYTFRAVLSELGGPLLRLVKLALGGADPGQSIDEDDLHLTERDLRVDPSQFEDLGPELQGLVGRVRSNSQLRNELAALWDHYLPRAKAEVFTGMGTDLLEVFEDVRREIASRGLELCIFIEDLVLLHGIDKQLAQALTVPASRELCKLRAVIAVTDGYLSSMDTFTDRGIHFTLDLELTMIGQKGLREFVGRYLNAGRVEDVDLIKQHEAGEDVPNGCSNCPVEKSCHETFGTSELGHGLYPFNGHALDRLVELASPGGFRPREIIRQVLRAPLEAAEDELPTGVFPSDSFARALDDVRKSVRPAVRQAVKRLNPVTGEAELSLRNFYAEVPPHADDELRRVAEYLGVQLVDDTALDLGGDARERGVVIEPPHPARDTPSDEIESWTTGSFLGAATARKVRKWICETVVGILAGGAHGVEVWKPKTAASEWYIGSHHLRMSDVCIPRARGGNSANPGDVTFTFDDNDDTAVILTGIIATVDGKEFSSYNRGRWFIDLLPKLDRFAVELAASGQRDRDGVVAAAAAALMTLRHESPAPGLTVREALPQILRPAMRASAAGASPDLAPFLNSVRAARREALAALRNRSVAGKGKGAPVLFDVAACYGTLRGNLNSRVLPAGSDASTFLTALSEVSMNQERVARRIGADVLGMVGKLRELLLPDEDLTTAIQLATELATEAQAQGVLGVPDARERLVEASRAIEAPSMEVYRKFARAEAAIRPEDVWDLIDDPRPKLQTLLTFATLTQRMFINVESYLANQAEDNEAVDVASAAQELRALADSIDVALEGTT